MLPCILVWSRQDTKTIGLKLKILESGYMIVIISLLKHYIVLKKISLLSKIPESTIYHYIKSGKLCKNKYYFYTINFKSNP